MTNIVFIASNYETFTPTQSGALATIVYRCCQVAREHGILPWVIMREAQTAPYEWENSILLPYPNVPDSGPVYWLARAERKLLGWSHAGQRQYTGRILEAIARRRLEEFPMVVLNNPETAIALRRKFPRARVFHWFQNQLEAKSRVCKELAPSLTGAFGVSDFTSRWVSQYYGLPQVSTVYNAVDASHFSCSSRAAKDKPVINFVGRTGREKAPDLLLRAALELSETTRNFSIQMVGSNHWDRFEMDDYQRELKGLAQQLETRDIEVMWTGHVGRERLPEVLGQADINVVPSRWDEPFGMVTLEGMACGLATVASNTGGTLEVCGDAALMFERDDVPQLTAHLRALINDAALREDYARRGQERAQLFSWQRTWDTLWSLVNHP